MPPLAPHNKYWFILGRETDISAAEITAVLNIQKYIISTPIFKADTAVANPKDLIKKLGGTIKIATELADKITEQELVRIITDELKTVSGKIHFGISIYTPERNDFTDSKLAQELGKKIKKLLKVDGLSVRYVENRTPILSSVTVEKNGLADRGREFIIEKKSPNLFSIAKTEAVQPFEEFSVRDFGRPGRDDVSGMLPPKLAMIMINLAKVKTDQVLLDPFCGSGTIISEAALLGYTHLIGTDISEKAIADTEKNLAWTIDNFGIDKTAIHVEIQTEAVENISKFLGPKSVDAIIAEPYMGRPLKGNEKKEELIKQANELKSLYLQAFAQFSTILKPRGRVVFLIPRFSAQGRSASGGKFNEWIRIECQKEIQQAGFTTLSFFEDRTPLVYARPNQRVAREIWGFEKIK